MTGPGGTRQEIGLDYTRELEARLDTATAALAEAHDRLWRVAVAAGRPLNVNPETLDIDALTGRVRAAREGLATAREDVKRAAARNHELSVIAHRLHIMLGLAAETSWAVIPDVIESRTRRAADRLDELAGPGGPTAGVEVRRSELRAIASTIRPHGACCGAGEQT